MRKKEEWSKVTKRIIKCSIKNILNTRIPKPSIKGNGVLNSSKELFEVDNIDCELEEIFNEDYLIMNEVIDKRCFFLDIILSKDKLKLLTERWKFIVFMTNIENMIKTLEESLYSKITQFLKTSRKELFLFPYFFTKSLTQSGFITKR